MVKKKEESKRVPKLGRVWDFRVKNEYIPGIDAITVTLKFFVLDATQDEAVQFAQKGMDYFRSLGDEVKE